MDIIKKLNDQIDLYNVKLNYINCGKLNKLKDASIKCVSGGIVGSALCANSFITNIGFDLSTICVGISSLSAFGFSGLCVYKEKKFNENFLKCSKEMQDIIDLIDYLYNESSNYFSYLDDGYRFMKEVYDLNDIVTENLDNDVKKMVKKF